MVVYKCVIVKFLLTFLRQTSADKGLYFIRRIGYAFLSFF
jgi:hypothetical protein